MPPQRSSPQPTTTNQQRHHPPSSSSMKVLSTHKRISLWLIPPEPILSSLTHTQHQLISFQRELDNNKNNREMPTFVPHVTLVGGVPLSECCTVQDDVIPLLLPSSSCTDSDINNGHHETTKQKETDMMMDEVAAKSLLKRLSCAFRNFGGVECTFVKERGVFAARRRLLPSPQRRMEVGAAVVNDNDLITRSPTSVTTNISDDDESNNKSHKSNNNNNNNREEEEVQWNQSCISIMERTETLIKAMELVERILFTERSSPSSSNNTTTATNNNNINNNRRSENDHQSPAVIRSLERHFKAPVCEPHYSFVYGNDAELITSLQQHPPSPPFVLSGTNDSQPPPRLVSSGSTATSTSSSSSSSSSSRSSSTNGTNGSNSSGKKERFVLECPPNFICTEIAVVWTYPSCLEGVKEWREIGRFTLEKKKFKY